MKRKSLRSRQVRAQNIIIAHELPVAMRNIFSDRRYRVRDVASMPLENIHNYIAMHPPVVIKSADMFHAIGNLRSVELSAYLDRKARIAVLEHEPVSHKKMAEMIIALEFGKLTFDALEILHFEQTALALWSLYKTQEGCPSAISTKKGLATLLSVNRRKFSMKTQGQLQSRFSGQERD